MGGNSPKDQSPRLSFQYEPTNKDLSMHLAAANGYSRVGNFLAVMPGKYFVHGNSEISLLDKNGKNVASQYDTLRQWRTWDLPPGTGYTAVGPVYKWVIDTEGNGPSWKDIPGAKFDASPPWREGRDLLEFVVAVDKHAEIGTLYFFVIVSLKPGQYRVQMSSALYSPYTGDSSPLGNSPQPWAEESGCTIKVDSGWLKAPAVPAAGGRQ